jgi:hypothetical protein
VCAGSNQYYYSTLFTTPLHQDENTFDIMEVPSKYIKWIIKFAYLRDSSFISSTNVNELYVIADHFGVLGLMKACIKFIVKNLSPENCIYYWLLSRYVSISSTFYFYPINILFSSAFRDRGINRLSYKSWNYIILNFVRVACVSNELLHLNVDDLFSIINDELLNAKV